MSETGEVPQRVTQIIQYVRDHYMKYLNLTFVANELNINYAYASTVFKKFTGSSFTDYLTRYRLAKAAELLENTNCYIYEVAGKVGFEEDNKNFYRLFKQAYGLTPSQYRAIRCEETASCD
jgi:two-component system response regulator YesN